MSVARAILWPAVVTSLSTTYFLTIGIQERELLRAAAEMEARRAEAAASATRLGTDLATLKREAAELETNGVEDHRGGPTESAGRSLKSTLAAQSRVLVGLSQTQDQWSERVIHMESRQSEARSEDERLKSEIATLSEKIRAVESALKARQEAEKLAAKKMGKMVANMPASKAADLLQELDDVAAVGLLSQMKEPDVARVLALLPPKRAAGLTERMAEFRVKSP